MRLPGDGMSWREFGKGLYHELDHDNVTDLAATVTYYGVLALFPFLLFLVALASVVITPAQAQQLVHQLAQVAPGEVTKIVGDRIQQLGAQQNVTLLGFGALGALWAASGATLALMRSLNTAYDVGESRPFWKVRAIALLMTVVAGVLALVGALAAVATEPLANAIGGRAGAAILWLRLPVAALVMMFLWALLYYVLPDVEQRFKFITPGSVFGVVLWVLASWGFGKYVANFGHYDKTYGSIAGVIVLLFWMWLSALVLLVGAEINALIEHRSPEGKREGAKSMQDTGMGPVARASAPDGPARAAPAPLRAPPRRRRIGGLTALVAGLAAGILIGRREA
ncbi:ribonuclease BN [Anaeromyxobacter sp. K]|uniref:YihY/virulence factor BrkB family protein n=1 Tax=Anaeromyxobacter sp. (strain K) TaxID=447217 RepID=UPI00015F8601|nr:YihY/virulence factor BrkB family protein [Anaeromyxobacter sp. K]ACG74349.1 ribonuclease BN [Anaeromyxobacter sp. K]